MISDLFPTSIQNSFKDEIQKKSDKGNDIRRRRLIPYHDWDKRTLLQLEELHLDNTNLHENDFEALYDAIKINPLTKYRNSNLKKIYIDRRDYTKNIKNDYIKEEARREAILREKQNQPMNEQAKEDKLYEELQTPIFVMILFFIFQMPFVKRLMKKYISTL